MSQCTSSSIPENVKSALVQLQYELEEIEKALLKLRQKKQEFLEHQLSMGIHKLATLANNINTLSNSMESEILNFKETAVEVNHLYHTIQYSPGFKALERDKTIMNCWQPLNIGEINHSGISVPTVIRRELEFVLTVKTIDFQEELISKQNIGQTTKSSCFQNAAENCVLEGIRTQSFRQVRGITSRERDAS